MEPGAGPYRHKQGYQRVGERRWGLAVVEGGLAAACDVMAREKRDDSGLLMKGQAARERERVKSKEGTERGP
jgi:hypothetical protein